MANREQCFGLITHESPWRVQWYWYWDMV